MISGLYHLDTFFPLLEPLVTLFVYHTSFPLALPYQKSQVYANFFSPFLRLYANFLSLYYKRIDTPFFFLSFLVCLCLCLV